MAKEGLMRITQQKDLQPWRLIPGRHAWVMVLFVLCGIPLVLPAQQSGLPVGLPARAPGYEHYYRDEQPATAFASRWGYHDGYEDGKRNKELGTGTQATEQDRYKLVPDHGLHADIPRAKYKTLYRSAYLNGYQYATKSTSD